MHSKRERRLQALESSQSERLQSLSEQVRQHIFEQMTDAEIELLAQADSAALGRFRELGMAAEAEGELPIFALNVGYWALEMQKAARI